MDAQGLIERLRAGDIEGRDLDEAVARHCRQQGLEQGRQEAARLNRGAMEGQVAYLLGRGETPASLLGAFGLPTNGDPEQRLEGAMAHCARVLRQLSRSADVVERVPSFGEGGSAQAALRHAEAVLEAQTLQRREQGSQGSASVDG